jgi:hypothetical protein
MRDPRSFSGRHVEAVTAHWQAAAHAGRMSPATIQTYFSFMRTFRQRMRTLYHPPPRGHRA